MPGVTAAEPYLTDNRLFVAGALPGGVVVWEEAHAMSNAAPRVRVMEYIFRAYGCVTQ